MRENGKESVLLFLHLNHKSKVVLVNYENCVRICESEFGAKICKEFDHFWIMTIASTIWRRSCKTQNRLFETIVFQISNIGINDISFYLPVNKHMTRVSKSNLKQAFAIIILRVVLLNLNMFLLTNMVLSKGSLKCPERLFHDIFILYF